MKRPLRIVSWNIQAGGGARADAIDAQLRAWQPTVVVLSEFRGTPPSLGLAHRLRERGLVYQRSTASVSEPRRNALLVASRDPLRRLPEGAGPADAARWLGVRIGLPVPIDLGAMHVPCQVSKRKYPFLDGLLEVARRWRRRPAILIGDTNTGLPGLDEETPVFGRRERRFVEGLGEIGWHDGFRDLHGEERVYSWYSPNGRNGFRLDHVYLTPSLRPALGSAGYRWAGGSARGPSDHAALIVDFQPSSVEGGVSCSRSRT